jgi:hypothetical protein
LVLTTHQPIFLPWPGFFAKALHADAMVLLDEVEFPFGRSWITRNRIKSDKGELWLIVPVWTKGKGKQIIRDVEICEDRNWRTKHLRSLQQQYANAPYLRDFLPAIESIYACRHRRLAELNTELIRHLWSSLGLSCRLVLQSDLGVSGKGTDLLVAVCRNLNADTYVTLQPVKKHLDPDRLKQEGIQLRFSRFDPPEYPQLWGDFRFNLSTLDLLLNCGPKAFDIIARSVT